MLDAMAYRVTGPKDYDSDKLGSATVDTSAHIQRLVPFSYVCRYVDTYLCFGALHRTYITTTLGGRRA